MNLVWKNAEKWLFVVLNRLILPRKNIRKTFCFFFHQICIVFTRNSAIVRTKMVTTTHQDIPTILIVNTGKLPPTYQIIITVCETQKLWWKPVENLRIYTLNTFLFVFSACESGKFNCTGDPCVHNCTDDEFSVKQSFWKTVSKYCLIIIIWIFYNCYHFLILLLIFKSSKF